MLRDTVAPALREMGFAGSGKRFAFRPGVPTGDFALLGVQGWKYNDASLAMFTLNLMFLTAEDWALAQAQAAQWGLMPDAKPSPNTTYFVGWEERVGYLSRPGHDHWWAVTNEADAEVVAADVIRRVRTFVVPQLTARLARTAPPPTFGDNDHPNERCKWPHCLGSDDDPW
jgi:hypothetical protein